MLFYFNLKVTTPAFTFDSTPRTTAFPLAEGHLAEIEVQIPRGHAGLTGIALKIGDVQVFPWANGALLSGDDERFTVPLDLDITAAGFSVITYNNGGIDHSHYLRASLDRIGPAPQVAALAVQPLLLPAKLTSS